ncbi:hypothetical protein CIW52_10790 [Mycolicibacterium sp. P9-64]|nr:hypothetical protein CIW52_10790 [Mycolicibacterium sp. P9-64]
MFVGVAASASSALEPAGARTPTASTTCACWAVSSPQQRRSLRRPGLAAIPNDPDTCFAEARVQAREEVKHEMAR